MFAFFLQSLTSLLLAGVFVYAVFTSSRLRNRKRVQQTLLGLVFGIMVVSLAMNSLLLEGSRAPFDAKSGPLIFAGYLGGPIGALIAGLCGALYRVSIGGPASQIALGIFMNLAIPAVGLAVSYLRPPRKWPATRNSAIAYMMVGFVALHFLSFSYLAGVIGVPIGRATLVTTGFAFIGSLSILVFWQILNYAFRFANDANRAAELAGKLDLAMTASGMGMFDHLKDDPGPVFDDRMMSIYGLDRASGMMPLEDWAVLVHRDDVDRVHQHMQQVWAGDDVPDRMDFRVIRPDGALRHIRATWTAQRDIDGSSKRVTGMHTDLTDIREAELRHQVSEDRLAMIADKLPGAFLEIDSTVVGKPKLLYVSPKCQEIWGRSADDFYADPMIFQSMHDPDDIEAFLTILRTSREAGEPIFHRYKITAVDGKTKWLDYHGTVSIENGRTIIKSIALEVTREVELQKQLDQESEISRRAQKNESIGQLTGGVAHDFNNLLAVILGNLEMLRDDDKQSAQKELIDTAIIATLRGADLTKNMLSFARKAPLSPVPLDLNKVVREAKNWIGRTLPESVVVETSLLAGLWSIEADRASLESALLNLILNARHAMENHGNLTIETANVRIDEAYVDSRQEELVPGRYVMLAVSDTGPGISDEVLESIFEPFFTTKPPGVGSGLGLSMTVGFMRQSGGTVQVYTEVGQGTTFKLYFPAANVQEQQPEKAFSGGMAGAARGKRLLLAEDEDTVRETLVKVLEGADYQVTATASGDAALAVFEADPTFDMLLTDIVMPGELQGTGLAKALRARWPDLPVLFMSGYASEATVHGNGLRPEDIRLMKPVQRADLLAAVSQVIADIKK